MRSIPRSIQYPLLGGFVCVLFGCSSPGYNDNPSQQITPGRVGCPATSGAFEIYFSIRVKPLAESNDAAVAQSMFRSYCGIIPAVGKAYFTADLVSEPLKREPVGLRVLRNPAPAAPAGEPHDAGTEQTVWEVPAQIYPKGVIETTFELRETGAYAVEIIRNRPNRDAAETLTIPLTVGMDSHGKSLLRYVLTNPGMIIGSLAFVGGLLGFFWNRKGA